MPEASPIYVDPRPPGRPSSLRRLRPLGRRLLGWPGLRSLRPVARRTLAVAEPAGRLHLLPLPRSPADAPGSSLTVLSANLWHDWPRHRRLPQRLEAFARLVQAEGADVVLLQEVARTPGLRADEWLASRLEMAAVYSRANGHEAAIGFEEGLAVLSRFPLEAPDLRQLASRANPFVRRLALSAMLHTPFGRLRAISVHLGLLPRQNATQLRRLQDWVAEAPPGCPALIGGDFNSGEGSARMARARAGWLDPYRQLHPTAPAATHRLRWPWGARRLDYIFLRANQSGWGVLEARHVDAPGGPHSDHRAVLLRLVPRLPAEDDGAAC